MKTIKSKKTFFTTNLKSLTMVTVFLSVVLFMSCSEQATIEELAADDTLLIEKIESASKTFVNAASLPKETKTAFNEDLSDSYIESVQLASGLGYKVSLFTDNQSRVEETGNIYFSMSGKLLKDNNEQRKGRRNKCFEFVFPVDFIMPDNTSITLDVKEDWVLIREWYQSNPTVKIRPTLIFPLNITLKDGTVQTILNEEELFILKDACKKNRDQRKCAVLVLPVSFTMPDATVINVNERAEFRLLREWHKANPRTKQKGSLIFPVNVIFKNGTTATITNEMEFRVANNSCRN